MPNLKDRTASSNFHGLIYGTSGAGKTHLIGEFPDPFIIDTDFGLDTLIGKDIEFEEYYKRVGDAGAKDAWPAILAKIEEFHKDPPHATLAVDSLTTLCDVVIANQLSKVGRTTLQLQDYSPIYDELTRLITRLRRCDCNVILTAHEDTFRDEYTGKVTVRPLVIGEKFTPRLPLFFNNIYYVDVEPSKRGNEPPTRTLLVQSDGKYLAKSQARNNDIRIPKSYDEIIKHLNKVS